MMGGHRKMMDLHKEIVARAGRLEVGLTHHFRVLNGCGQFIFRPERSCGCELGVVGNDAASSAQLNV